MEYSVVPSTLVLREVPLECQVVRSQREPFWSLLEEFKFNLWKLRATCPDSRVAQANHLRKVFNLKPQRLPPLKWESQVPRTLHCVTSGEDPGLCPCLVFVFRFINLRLCTVSKSSTATATVSRVHSCHGLLKRDQQSTAHLKSLLLG